MKAGILLLLLAALVLAFLSFFVHGLDISSTGYLTTEDGIITAVVIMGIICLVLVYLLYQRAVSGQVPSPVKDKKVSSAPSMGRRNPKAGPSHLMAPELVEEIRSRVESVDRK